MVGENMILNGLQLVAVEMNQLSALFTLAMEAGILAAMVMVHIFKVSRIAAVHEIFIHHTILHQPFQLTVHSGSAHRHPLCLEMVANFLHGHMSACIAAEIICQQLLVFAFVLYLHGAFTSFNLKIIFILLTDYTTTHPQVNMKIIFIFTYLQFPAGML